MSGDGAMAMNYERNCFSILEFCHRNAVGRTTVYSEIKAGRLRPKKVGRRTLISRAEEERWVASSDPVAATRVVLAGGQDA